MRRRLHQPADLGASSSGADGLARAFPSLSSDIALIVDAEGIVTAVVQDERAPMNPAAQRWVGHPWAQTVTGQTRRKIENLLADASAGGLGRRREVNHATAQGDDLPVAYAALRLGERGSVLAVGRDLRSVAAIQQSFLDTQQALERGYWRARHDEASRRRLAQVATDAVVTVHARTGCLIELNPAAAALLGTGADALLRQPLAQQFDARSRLAVLSLLARAEAGRCTAESRVRLAGSHVSVQLVATLLPGAPDARVVVRLRAADRPADDVHATGGPAPSKGAPEAIVVTDAEGRVREANAVFLQMVQAERPDLVQGLPLSTWMPATADALVQRVQGLGIAAGHRNSIRRRDGAQVPVRVAGALMCELESGGAAFTLHPLGTRSAMASDRNLALEQELDTLAADLGRETLPQLVRRAQMQAQAHLVNTALDRTGGDARAAARLLCIGPDLFVRLQRELDTDAPRPPR